MLARTETTSKVFACTACGAAGEAKCSCGKPYAYQSPGKIAELALKAHPEKSDRAIAQELGVSDMTVGRARKQLTATNVAVEKRTGRDGKKRKPPVQKPEVKEKAERVIAFAAAGMKAKEIAAEVGYKDERNVHQILEHERIRQEGYEDAYEDALAQAAIKVLSLSAKERFDAALRRVQKAMLQENLERRTKDYKEHWDRLFPTLEQQQRDAYAEQTRYRQWMKEAEKIFTPAEFRLILMCLHPDGDRSPEKRAEAFRLFNSKRFAMTGETEPKKAKAFA